MHSAIPHPVGRGAERQPRGDPRIREPERRRHHADHGEGIAVEGDGAADDRGIGPEVRLPGAVAQHDHLLVRPLERASEHRSPAEHREETRGRVGDGDARRVLGDERDLPVEPGADAGDALRAGAQVLEVGPGYLLDAPFGGDFVEPEQAVGFGIGQRPEQHRVDHAEHERVGGDHQRQGRARGQRIGRTPPERTQGPAQVIAQVRQQFAHAHPPVPGLRQFLALPPHRARVAEALLRLRHGRVAGEPASHPFAHQQLEVMGELVRHFTHGIRLPPEPLEPRAESQPPRHPRSGGRVPPRPAPSPSGSPGA
jgi:hypothetical protein